MGGDIQLPAGAENALAKCQGRNFLGISGGTFRVQLSAGMSGIFPWQKGLGGFYRRISQEIVRVKMSIQSQTHTDT